MVTARRRATPGAGRPSKGDRHTFGVRMPREHAQRVIAYADATDSSYTDVIAQLVARHLDELDAEAVNLGGNRLDVEAAQKTA